MSQPAGTKYMGPTTGGRHGYGLDTKEGSRETDNNKMDMNNASYLDEKIIIKRQWISVIIAYILAIVGIVATMKMLGPGKYALLGVSFPGLYLSISSIKNRISVMRPRGQKGYSRGSQAVFWGIFLLIINVIQIVIIFSPFLDVFPHPR